jgi:hypothetical protein
MGGVFFTRVEVPFMEPQLTEARVTSIRIDLNDGFYTELQIDLEGRRLNVKSNDLSVGNNLAVVQRARDVLDYSIKALARQIEGI